jgi:hypothetical protein
MAACIMRAIWSDAPPAPAATTISIDLVGSHATAWRAHKRRGCDDGAGNTQVFHAYPPLKARNIFHYQWKILLVLVFGSIVGLGPKFKPTSV